MIAEDQYMPPPQSFRFGDCGPEVVAMVRRALEDGVSDFKVIEGMVATETDKEPVPHYWIERGGKVYDPTKSQFSGEIQYSPPGSYRRAYSPRQFLREQE